MPADVDDGIPPIHMECWRHRVAGTDLWLTYDFGEKQDRIVLLAIKSFHR